MFQGYVLHVVSAASEWIMCLAQLVFFVTFIGEFKQYSISAPEVSIINRLLEREYPYRDPFRGGEDTPIGGSKGGHQGCIIPAPSPIPFILCSFQEKLGKIIGWRPHLGSCPPHLKNPGSATDFCPRAWPSLPPPRGQDQRKDLGRETKGTPSPLVNGHTN